MSAFGSESSWWAERPQESSSCVTKVLALKALVTAALIR